METVQVIEKEQRVLSHDSHCKEFRWQSFDKKELDAVQWFPSQKQKAKVLYLNNYGMHYKWLNNTALKLSEYGYALASINYEISTQKNGSRALTGNLEKYINKLEEYINYQVEKDPGTKTYIIAEGFAANQILSLVSEKNMPIHGVVALSPWFSPSKGLSTFNLLKANLFRFLLPNKTMKLPGFVASEVSRDLRVVYKYENDKLVCDKIGYKLYCQTLRLGEFTSKTIYKINTPLLIFHGDQDQIASVDATREYVRNASSKTKFVEVKGGKHFLLHDLDKPNTQRHIIEWMENL